MEEKKPRKISLTAYVICLIIMAVIVVGLVFYIVQNKDENAEKLVDTNSKSQNNDEQKTKFKPVAKENITSENIGEYIAYDCLSGDGMDKNYTVSSSKSGYSSEQGYMLTEEIGEIKWKILGLDENNQVLIISDPIDVMRLEGKEGYVNGVDELNNVCKIFGYGIGAEEARSINMQDINKICKYNPKEDEYYNEEYKYTLENDGKIYANGEKGIYERLTYYSKDTNSWDELKMNESLLVKNTSYGYNMSGRAPDLIKYKDGTRLELDYWVATSCESAGKWGVSYSMFYIDGDDVHNQIMYMSGMGKDFSKKGFRPVVKLSKDIKLSRDSNGIWQIDM